MDKPSGPAPHVLFEFTPLDGREEIDDKTQRTYMNLKQLIANKSVKESNETYLKYIATNAQQNTEDLTMGLLVAVLAEQDNQQARYYRDVVSFTKDGLNQFSTYFNIIIIERQPKLREHCRKQMFWLTHQLIKANIVSAENICSNLCRSIAGGDVTPKNLWLIENLLELLIENRGWLINQTTFMIPTTIYTFMRLISDHLAPNFSCLRQKEVDFVIGLIREKFLDCLQIGRDFLRLLHNINKVPEFEKLWHDIHNNPKSLHPTFSNPLQILSKRTPRRLFQSRLTFDMERKIAFLATQVKFGNQKRYQDWFHKQYLSTTESLSLRCDLIRYICTIIHPSNEVLCSDIIPRWAIIGWLLTTCNTSVSATNSKLALFFDWLLYDIKTDNIMNIEPAILVMYYSMRSHPLVTANLLDFLCRIPTIFSPKLADHLKAGVKKSLQQILEKRVIQSLAPLFDNPKHDPALKALIKETYPEFCAGVVGHVDNGISGSVPPTMTPQQQIPASPSQPPSNLSPTPALANTTTTATVGAGIPITVAASHDNHQTGLSNSAVNNNNNNNINKHQQVEVINLDQDKVTMSQDIVVNDSAVDHANVKTLSSQEINHTITTNKVSDTAGISQMDEKPDSSQLSNSLSSPSSTISSSTTTTTATTSITTSASLASSPSTSSRDENKAFSWNGTENANASYSHKQNHDNKSRKSSLSSNSGTVDSSKKNKGANVDSVTTEALNSLSKHLQLTIASDQIENTANEFGQDENSAIKVIYPFMTVSKFDLKEKFGTFDEPIRCILEDLNQERCQETRCGLMDKLISLVFDNSGEQSTNVGLLKDLGHCMAYLVVEDFATRIFPSSSSHDNELLEESIGSPLFVLCRSAFSNTRSTCTINPMSLLTAISEHFEATGFLILYFLRVTTIVNGTGTGVSTGYLEFCTIAKRKLSRCLQDDLFKALTYDSEMFCFLLPSVFGDIASSGKFLVTGNIELIQMVVSALDPIYLQELICLCLTGTAKIISKDEVLSLVESSLSWESWEQYCVWKLISAQSIPIENYISILPKLDTKANAEAMSCILLNLQKVSDPTANMLQHIINCECKPNNPFISSILRYWSMRTDIKDLAKMIASLFDSRPPSPQVKRKGQTKAAAAASKNSTSLSPKSEKLLQHLDSIRQRAPKNKLLAQTEILEMLSNLEALCNQNQKKRFAELFSNRPKPTKKQKRMDKEVIAV